MIKKILEKIGSFVIIMVQTQFLNSLKHALRIIFPCTILLGVTALPAEALNINRLSSTDAGAEIATYDPISQQLFITNPDNKVDYFNISDPANPGSVSSIDLTPYGAGVQSVAVKNGILAIALQADPVTDPGTVAFFDTSGNFQNQVTVGALPDMLTFTPDGNKILVANEGERRPDPNDPMNVIDPDGSVSIIDISGGILNPTVTTATFNSFNGQENALRSQGVRIEAGKTVAQDVEPEYIAVSSDSTKAWVGLQENNAIAVLNIVSQQIESIEALGTKDHNTPDTGLDPSDRDDGININPWPVLGMYMPDSIATLEVNGEIYLLTANEGDARDPEDVGGQQEEIRIKDIDPMDLALFPNAATLQEDENLGRLTVSQRDGRNAQGQYTSLHAYGARSFTIWNTNGFGQVYDSGDDFEQITAQLTPSIFNSDDEPNSFDSRSDAKGPEPEGLTVGKINDRYYGFTGLERIGGFMVYDVTDPANPSFTDYINDRSLGDLSPEGLLFISAEYSPNGNPLLVVTNEVSQNVVIYSVKTPEPSSLLGLLSVGMIGYWIKKGNKA